MDLTRFAFARPHVLLLEAPGGTGPRLAVERLARERGWPLVDSPADADILTVAGAGLHEQVQRVWDQLPGPRARITLLDPDRAEPALDEAARSLVDLAGQREDAAARQPSAPPPHQPDSGHAMDDGGGGSGHDMGGGDMPAGLPMADRAPDRDGLELDILHVPWGPALPWWPAGLVVQAEMQGDVLAQVEVTRLGSTAQTTTFWSETAEAIGPGRSRAAARLDSLTRLLAVAGWEAERLRTQRVRDALLAGAPDDAVAAQLQRLTRRVGRSRVLARMTAALGFRTGAELTDRYRGWLADAAEFRDVDASERLAAQNDGADAVSRLADLLTGAEWSAARLIVAGLDPELTGAPTAGADRA